VALAMRDFGFWHFNWSSFRRKSGEQIPGYSPKL